MSLRLSSVFLWAWALSGCGVNSSSEAGNGAAGVAGRTETGAASSSNGASAGAGAVAGSADAAGSPFGGFAAAAGTSNGGTSNGGTSNGGTSNGGTSNGGTSNSGTSNGGTSNSSGAGGAGTTIAGSGGGASPPNFTCNLVFGVSPTGQWFDSGFLDLVDSTRWESIWVAHHYTNLWADPRDAAWSTAFDPYPGPEHACAQHSNTPDRILFVAVNWKYTNAGEWESDLTKIVHNLQAKYPSVQRIELMTLTRAPGNKLCSAKGSSETIIPAWTDVAIAAMMTQFPGLVVPAPKFEVPHCSDFLNDGAMPQYTTAGAAEVAQAVGAYYAEHP